MKRKGRRTKGRKPTYKAATRLAGIVLQLASQPWGMGFDSICRRFSISERTLLRYIAASRQELHDWAGRPQLEVVQHGQQRRLRLAQYEQVPSSTAYQAASFYFTLTMLRFLAGTILGEGVEDLWEKLYQELPSGQRLSLKDIERKFYAVAYVPKQYAKQDELLDLLLRSILLQWRLSIDYFPLGGDAKTHRFDPYTLVAYRDGLYLFGHSNLHSSIVYLAVERIQSATPMKAEDGHVEQFSYPKGYRPHNYLDGVFGLIEGPETHVELLLLGSTEALLRSRAIHPSQQIRQRADGKFVLSLNLKGTTELRNWILGMGPWIEVLRPKTLRNEVAGLLREGAALYRQATRS